MPKVVGTHLLRKRLDQLVGELVQVVDRAGGAFAQCCLQPGEGLLDWIEVGRVGRQIAHAGTDSLNRLVGAGDLVSVLVDPAILETDDGRSRLPGASLPNKAASASEKPPVETPLR